MSDCSVQVSLLELQSAVQHLFEMGGLESEKAEAIAQVLIEADATGHHTHGLALAPSYYDALIRGDIAHEGHPEVVSDRGSCVAWNGRRLPGAWLVSQAMALACERVRRYGITAISIANSHHVGALSAYLTKATDIGLMAIIASSTPSAGGVAPYGGMRGLFTPNPLAAGIPTEDSPILLDISASITTRNNASQLIEQGSRFPGTWAMDQYGNPTDDPAVVFQGGTLLPVGGQDHGHKGYAMALLVESLTQGLSGLGRKSPPPGIYSSLYVQVIDPEFFAGLDAYASQTQWIAQSCRDNPPLPGKDAVRVPGDRAAKIKQQALREGLSLSSVIWKSLTELSQRTGCPLPEPLLPSGRGVL